ncbi:MAG TPA: hypothetical protein VMS75_04710 [Terriglobales bacterium]|nr:hypothetical protein [Terriglobales bacterium]
MKALLRAVVAAALAASLFAAAASAVEVEARAGYFIPSSRDVRAVYPNGVPFGADISVPLLDVISVWGGIDIFRKTGKLTYTEEPTMLRVMPVFLGLKLGSVRRSRAVRPYAAAAAGYFSYKETNVIGTASGRRLGLVAQAGLLVRLKGRVSLDFHARYTMVKAAGQGADAVATELGGFQGGLGIAVGF